MADTRIKKNKIIPALVIFLAVFFLPSYEPTPTYQGRILYQTQSFYGDIKIIKVGPYRCLFVNGAGQSCLKEDKKSDSAYIRQIAEVVSQINPRKILLMGMAGGAVLSVLPSKAEIEVVEIDPKVVNSARKYDLMPEKDYTIFYDDARRFVRKRNNDYDLIIMDLALGDNLPFYMLTKEAFGDIRNLMAERGVFFIHLSIFPEEKDDPFLNSVVKTLGQVMDGIEVVSTTPEKLSNVSILGSLGPEIRWEKFYKFSDFDLSRALTITDNYNPLEGYFLPHVLDLRKGEKALGLDVYLVN